MAEAEAASFGAASLATEPPATDAYKARVLRSAFDDLLRTVALRSEVMAQILRENPAFIDAMKRLARWVLDYLTKHQLEPHEIKVTGSMTPDGAVVLQIEKINA
jgi:hypothetical protein